MKGLCIAVIEDDPLLLDSLALFLQVNGCRVESFGRAEEFCKSGSFRRFDVVICDYLLPGENGASVLRRVREESKTVFTILITAYRGKELPEEAERAGVDVTIRKPFSTADLEDTLRRWIGRGRANDESLIGANG